jgi:hypothetical protein
MRNTSLIIGGAAVIFAAVAAGTTAMATQPPGAKAPVKYVKTDIDGYYYHLPEGAKNNLDAVRALIAAGNGMGMVRVATWQNTITEGDGSRPCIGCTTDAFEYRGSGLFDGKQVKAIRIHFDLRVPAARIDVTPAEGARTVSVAKGDVTWDEATPGVFKAASSVKAAERLLPVLLLPHTPIAYGGQVADKVKVATQADGTRILTVPLPVLDTNMTAAINGNGQVFRTEFTYGGKVYVGEYSEFTNDHMDYHVFGPHRVVQKVDGKVVTDLQIERHWVNPYMVFPTPKELASK